MAMAMAIAIAIAAPAKIPRRMISILVEMNDIDFSCLTTMLRCVNVCTMFDYNME